jgi:cytoskeletal protein RodZ
MVKLGEKFIQARNEKGLSLEDVSKKTKIRKDFLNYIEKGEYQKLPSFSYAQGFVRSYARFLELDEEEIMAIFRREFDDKKAYKVLPKGFETEEFSVSKFRLSRSFYFAIFALIIFFAFILFQFRYAFLNPPLEIESPKNNSVISSSQVVVSGKTEPDIVVYVNSDLVSVDESGNFKKNLVVFPGKITINVKAISRFEKKTEKSIQITVK